MLLIVLKAISSLKPIIHLSFFLYFMLIMLVFDFIFQHILKVDLISIQHMDFITINQPRLPFNHSQLINLCFLFIMTEVRHNRMEMIMAFMVFMVIEKVIPKVIKNLRNVIIEDVQAFQIMEIVIIINPMEKKVSSFLPIRFLIYFYPLIQLTINSINLAL